MGKRSREESGDGLVLESLKQYRGCPGAMVEAPEAPRLAQLVLSGEGRLGEESGGEEGRKVGDHWPGEGESDAESVDSEGEDGLKHAGVYTGEEVRVALFAGNKL